MKKKNIISHFNNKGISNKRLIFIQPKNRKEYLNSYNLVDINLDTFPYNGGTTLLNHLIWGPNINKREQLIFISMWREYK